MNRMSRYLAALTIGLFLVGVTIPSQAGVTSKVKKTAKKTASKAKDTAKKGAEKTNDTVHKGADKVRDAPRVKQADAQAKQQVDGLTDVFKEVVK